MKVKSILVSLPTPTQPEKSPYYQLQTKYGIEIEYRTFTTVEGLSAKEFKAQKIAILEHTAVIFTSRTTVDHFFRVCGEAKITIPETMKYICNSETIALYLQKYVVYRKRRISFGDGGFTSLMELVVKNKKEKQLLVLSEPYNPELADTMKKMKIKFSGAIFSRIVNCNLADLEMKKFDLIALFASVAVSSLISQFEIKSLPQIVTFGESATLAAKSVGLNVVAMAPTPEAPSMAKAIDILIEKKEKGEKIAPVEVEVINEAELFLKKEAEKQQRKKRVSKVTV